ncbi:hypothetical protein CDCA_CDCA03G0815 [Cyanidium caldarium]|uniref:Uncharacterized protein n=1 Tax=Cyanidium caldarium TaxID=2771 RepID=A0AAV9IRS5_CYACA|nr:hypothetical protein CDCA_CDCA03G0815 [Cyanidium caldarium]
MESSSGFRFRRKPSTTTSPTHHPLCASIPADLPQEIRLQRLCERVLSARYEHLKRQLVTGDAGTTEWSLAAPTESRHVLGVVQEAFKEFLRALEHALTGGGAGTFDAINQTVQRGSRPNERNAQRRAACAALAELERRYRAELDSWDDAQQLVTESAVLDESVNDWDGDASSALPAYDAREAEAQRRHVLETLLLQVDQLEHCLRRLHAHYTEADAFCVEAAKRLNAVAFDGFLDVGNTRLLLQDAATAVGSLPFPA